ncbi:MAG: hypothetical protein AABW47_04350 [Nanoarchaeota archaeon]
MEKENNDGEKSIRKVKKERVKKETRVIEDEIFNIKKEGEKVETIRTEILEEDKPAPKEQIKKESKIFVGVIIVMTSFILMFLGLYILMNSINHFEQDGVKFELLKTGQLAFYHTTLPVIYNNSKTEYNFYLRTNPRTLSDIPFDGRVLAKKEMVINMEKNNATKNFNCDGDGVIAVANLVKLYEFIGTKVIRNESIGCDPLARYMYVNIKEGNETRVTQVGPICYNIEIKDCEILKGTEKFMLETFIELNKKLRQSGQ